MNLLILRELRATVLGAGIGCDAMLTPEDEAREPFFRAIWAIKRERELVRVNELLQKLDLREHHA